MGRVKERTNRDGSDLGVDRQCDRAPDGEPGGYAVIGPCRRRSIPNWLDPRTARCRREEHADRRVRAWAQVVRLLRLFRITGTTRGIDAAKESIPTTYDSGRSVRLQGGGT